MLWAQRPTLSTIWPVLLREADVAFMAMRSPTPLITPHSCGRLASAGVGDLLIADLAVPAQCRS